jgi:hypothetical protein
MEPCNKFSPSVGRLHAAKAADREMCAKCGEHRIDHAMDAGGIGHPLDMRRCTFCGNMERISSTCTTYPQDVAVQRLDAVKEELRDQRARHATPSIKRAVAKVDGKPFIMGPQD